MFGSHRGGPAPPSDGIYEPPGGPEGPTTERIWRLSRMNSAVDRERLPIHGKGLQLFTKTLAAARYAATLAPMRVQAIESLN